MSTRTLAALFVVGALLIGSMIAVIAAAAPTDGDAASELKPSCPEHGKSGPCAKLNSEQREQVHAQIRQMRGAGASRKEIRAAVQETLNSFGVEAPETDCGAKKAGPRMKKAGCGQATSACGRARVGCGEVRAGCGEDKGCGGDKDGEANCEKQCDKQCCSTGGDASTCESPVE